MSLRDLYSNLAVDQLVDPATTTADVNSTSIDLRGYDSVMLVANVGASGIVHHPSGGCLVRLAVQA